jgi:hypothetical protein
MGVFAGAWGPLGGSSDEVPAPVAFAAGSENLDLRPDAGVRALCKDRGTHS